MAVCSYLKLLINTKRARVQQTNPFTLCLKLLIKHQQRPSCMAHYYISYDCGVLRIRIEDAIFSKFIFDSSCAQVHNTMIETTFFKWNQVTLIFAQTQLECSYNAYIVNFGVKSIWLFSEDIRKEKYTLDGMLVYCTMPILTPRGNLLSPNY